MSDIPSLQMPLHEIRERLALGRIDKNAALGIVKHQIWERSQLKAPFLPGKGNFIDEEAYAAAADAFDPHWRSRSKILDMPPKDGFPERINYVDEERYKVECKLIQEAWESTGKELELLRSELEGEAPPSPPRSGAALAPVKWKWGPADLGWLYESLTRKGAIECGPSSFAALFAREDGGAVSTDLSNAYKGEAPKRQGMKDTMDAISRHSPENDRK